MSCGEIEKFVIGRSDWFDYKKRLFEFFVANNINDDKRKLSIYLNKAGEELVSLTGSLCSPEAQNQANFLDLVTIVDCYFSPVSSEALHRYKFYNRDQQKNESIFDFMKELRKLSVNCNFGVQKDLMLRDRLVWGIRNVSIRAKLLKETELTLPTAILIALENEIALHTSENNQNVSNSSASSNTRGMSSSSTSNTDDEVCSPVDVSTSVTVKDLMNALLNSPVRVPINPSKLAPQSPKKQKTYKCPKCPIKFDHQSTLKHHFVKHTNDKPFKCNFCHRTFKSQGACYNHKKKLHKN